MACSGVDYVELGLRRFHSSKCLGAHAFTTDHYIKRLNRIKKLSDAIDSLGPFSEERSSFSSSILADSHQVGFDKEGRVILPSELISSVGIKNEIAFIGMGETFQMWDPETYNNYKKENQKQAQEKLSKLQWSKDI